MSISAAMQAQFTSLHTQLSTYGNELTGIRLALVALQHGEVVSPIEADPRRAPLPIPSDATVGLKFDPSTGIVKQPSDTQPEPPVISRQGRVLNVKTGRWESPADVPVLTQPIEHRLRHAVHDLAKVAFWEAPPLHLRDETMIRWENEMVLVLLELTGR